MSTPDDQTVAAHVEKITHGYYIAYPAHEVRAGDPHYVDFRHIRRLWAADPLKWQCGVGLHRADFSECDLTHPLELHHFAVEFSLQNGINLAWLERDYPGVSDVSQVGAWTESAVNLEILCRAHHRGNGGKHVASYADYTASLYVAGLFAQGPPA